MSEITGTPPAHKPAAHSSQAPQKVPGRDTTRDNTSAKDQNPSPKEGQGQPPRTSEGARFDTAVQLSPSMAHLRVGDVIHGEIASIDGEGRPVLETPQAVYAIEPHAGLAAKSTVEIIVQEIERKAIGELVAKDGVKLDTPLTLTLTVTVLHGKGTPAETPETAPTPKGAPPQTSQVYHATATVGKNTDRASEAAFLAELSSRPKMPAGAQNTTQSAPVAASAAERALPNPQGINSAIATILNAVSDSDNAATKASATANPAPAISQSIPSTALADTAAQTERLPHGIVLAQRIGGPEEGKSTFPIPAFVALNVTPLTAGDAKAAPAPIPTVGNTMTAIVTALPGFDTSAGGEKPTLPHTAMVLETPHGAFRLITPIPGAAVGDKMNVLMLDVPLHDVWNTPPQSGTITPQAPTAPQGPEGGPPQQPAGVTSPTSPQNAASHIAVEAPASPEAPKGTASPSGTVAPDTAPPPSAPNTASQPASAQTGQIPSPSAQALPPFLPIADYMKEWPVMDALSNAVALADPSAAAALHARMPSATPQLAGAALFFLSALGLQNPRVWMGSKVEGALDKAGGGNWLDKLTEEFLRLRVRTEAATGQAMEWRPHVVPFKTDDGVNAFIVFDRPKDDEKDGHNDEGSDEQRSHHEKKRFVLALDLKNLGPFELDALWNKNIVENTGKLDLVVRVGNSFHEGLKSNLKSMALATMEASGLSGSLTFEDIENSPLHSKELLGRIEQSLHHENRVI